MSSRTGQMLAALVAVAVMAVVVVKYGLGDDAPSTASEPHVGTAHHTAELPGSGGKPAHEGNQRSPVDVYANAKVGDWRAYTIKTEWSSKPPVTTTALARIAAVDDTRVVRSTSGDVDATGEVRPPRDEERPRQGLTIDQLVGNDVGGSTIHRLVVTDDEHTVGGRTFKCKKLTFSSNDPLASEKRTRTELWISEEVPVGGIVEERQIQDTPDMTLVQTRTLVGFGNGDRATWGTRPSGI